MSRVSILWSILLVGCAVSEADVEHNEVRSPPADAVATAEQMISAFMSTCVATFPDTEGMKRSARAAGFREIESGKSKFHGNFSNEALNLELDTRNMETGVNLDYAAGAPVGPAWIGYSTQYCQIVGWITDPENFETKVTTAMGSELSEIGLFSTSNDPMSSLIGEYTLDNQKIRVAVNTQTLQISSNPRKCDGQPTCNRWSYTNIELLGSTTEN